MYLLTIDISLHITGNFNYEHKLQTTINFFFNQHFTLSIIVNHK